MLLSGCLNSGDSSGKSGDDSAVKRTLQVDAVGLAPSPTPHHPMDIFWDIGFVDATTGYAVGDGSIFYKTIDGGLTWTLIPMPAVFDNPPYVQAIHTIHFETPNLGFVSGYKSNHGYIAKTTDKGQTWTIKTPFMTGYAEEIEFNGNICLAAGFTGFVMRSADGGETWSPVTSLPATETFDRIYMDDPGRYYIGGRLGVYISTDQGQSWSVAESQPLPSAIYRGTLHMQSATIGYSYDASELVKTTDGAKTWSTVWKSAPGVSYQGGTLMVPEPEV